MSLIRRCDGCGNDMDGMLSADLLQVRVPDKHGGRNEFDFHNFDCIMLWLQREHR